MQQPNAGSVVVPLCKLQLVAASSSYYAIVPSMVF